MTYSSNPQNQFLSKIHYESGGMGWKASIFDLRTRSRKQSGWRICKDRLKPFRYKDGSIWFYQPNPF